MITTVAYFALCAVVAVVFARYAEKRTETYLLAAAALVALLTPVASAVVGPHGFGASVLVSAAVVILASRFQ